MHAIHDAHYVQVYIYTPLPPDSIFNPLQYKAYTKWKGTYLIQKASMAKITETFLTLLTILLYTSHCSQGLYYHASL